MKLADRFAALWERIGAKGDPAPVFAKLEALYGEERRAYHTLGHIGHCLHELDWAPEGLCNKNVVELALWFHDSVHDDEEESAKLAARVLREAGVEENIITLVTIAILDTKHTGGFLLWETSKFTVDCDLAIFGQPANIWNKSSENIRKEYSYVPWFLYKKKRREILQGFLDRSYAFGIYYTPFFRDKYEEQARTNLKHAIAELK
jgi:predicted metal-dependent HD superfamily phosphohydrolase